MDRLLLHRGLVALGGLALVLASSGCRDRNLRVPPPAHYTDGDFAIPEAAGGAGPPTLSADPSRVDPYAGAGFGDRGTFDPAASPTSGVFGAAGAGLSYDPAAGIPGLATAPAGSGLDGYQGPYASPSSPAPYAVDPSAIGPVADPYASLHGAAGSPGGFSSGGDGLPIEASPSPFPGLDGGLTVPPIPDTLPEMP